MSAIRTHFLAKSPSFANLDRWKWKINSTTKFFCKKNSILVRKVEILCLEIIYHYCIFVYRIISVSEMPRPNFRISPLHIQHNRQLNSISMLFAGMLSRAHALICVARNIGFPPLTYFNTKTKSMLRSKKEKNTHTHIAHQSYNSQISHYWPWKDLVHYRRSYLHSDSLTMYSSILWEVQQT